jgi:hypothetical protein
MSDMIQRVAIAICTQQGKDPHQMRDDGLPPSFEGWTRYVDLARVAIEAMREPTKEMLDAGWIDKEDVDPGDIWHAMIGRALGDGE